MTETAIVLEGESNGKLESVGSVAGARVRNFVGGAGTANSAGSARTRTAWTARRSTGPADTRTGSRTESESRCDGACRGCPADRYARLGLDRRIDLDGSAG